MLILSTCDIFTSSSEDMFSLLLITKFVLTLPLIIACPKTPNITFVYISHRIQDKADPYYYVTVYWTPETNLCGNETFSHYEISICDDKECHGLLNLTEISKDTGSTPNVSFYKLNQSLG